MNTSRLWRGLSGAYAALIFVVLIALSFNASKLRNSWGGFSLKWYVSLFQNDRIIQALINTLLISFSAALVATFVGTLAAIALNNMRKGAARTLLLDVTYIPMLNPDIVTGVALLLLFTFAGITLGFGTLLLAHIAFNIPYVVLSVLPKLKQLSPNTMDAALDLGMRPAKALWKVIIPQIFPGMMTGFLLALTMSIDDFAISFFTTGPGVSTLSIEIYSMTRRGINPEINALSTLMFVVVLAMLIFVNFRSDKGDGQMINIG